MTIELKTKGEALTMALFLAITADTEEKSQRALRHANEIANSGMTFDEVQDAKRAAKALAGVA